MDNCEHCKIFTILFPYYGIRNKILEYYGDYHTSNDLEYSDSIDILYDRSASSLYGGFDWLIIDFFIFCKSRKIIKESRLMYSEFVNDDGLQNIMDIINKHKLKINFKGIYNEVNDIPKENVLFFDNSGNLSNIDTDIYEHYDLEEEE